MVSRKKKRHRTYKINRIIVHPKTPPIHSPSPFLLKFCILCVKLAQAFNHLAALNGHTETAKLLIEKSTNIQEYINSKNNYGFTPLYYATLNGHIETAKLLIEKGANIQEYINEKDNNGLTPLYYAALNGHTETAKLLKEYKKQQEKFDELITKLKTEKIKKTIKEELSNKQTPPFWKQKITEELIKIYNNNNKDKKGLTLSFLKQCIFLNPIVKTIPFIFDYQFTNDDIRKLIKKAKKNKNKKFVQKIVNSNYVKNTLFRTKKLPFPPEIVCKIMSYSDGDFNFKSLSEN